jgi:hypothetical protein
MAHSGACVTRTIKREIMFRVLARQSLNIAPAALRWTPRSGRFRHKPLASVSPLAPKPPVC